MTTYRALSAAIVLSTSAAAVQAGPGCMNNRQATGWYSPQAMYGYPQQMLPRPGSMGHAQMPAYTRPHAGTAMTHSTVMMRRQAHAARAGLTGWAFGTGYFVVALVWITHPFQVDAARYGWMAPFALVLLASGLALFWGLGFWLARRWWRSSTPRTPKRSAR